MQPITQASLDPRLNDIRHLRADQEFCGVIGFLGSSQVGRDCSMRCGLAGKQNCNESSRSTSFALGLAIPRKSLSRVTCWSPKMILPRRPAWRRCWLRGEMLGGVGRVPGNGHPYPISASIVSFDDCHGLEVVTKRQEARNLTAVVTTTDWHESLESNRKYFS